MGKPPATLAELRGLLQEIRNDLAALSEAIASILHGQDDQVRCLRVILKLTKHLHGRPVKPKPPRRGVH